MSVVRIASQQSATEISPVNAGLFKFLMAQQSFDNSHTGTGTSMRRFCGGAEQTKHKRSGFIYGIEQGDVIIPPRSVLLSGL